MVKNKALLVFALGAMMAMGHMSAPSVSSGMKEVAEDYAANKGVGLHVLRAEGAGFEHSQTFVQSGVNKDGQDVLRFATAVKGDVDSLSYTRFALEGAESGSLQATDNVVPVTAIYKSVQVSEGSAYYNGTSIVGEATTATEGWYWACYSITFTSSTYKASDVRVQLTAEVGGKSEKLKEESLSLNKVKFNMGEYIVNGVGNKYSGSYVSLEVVDRYTAKATYGDFEINAEITDQITDQDGEFLVFGDSENGFKAAFDYGRVTVKGFVYNGEDKMSSRPSGYDADLLVRLTSFSLSFSSTSSYDERVDSETTYNVQVGDTEYMYIYTDDDASYSVSYESTDDSKVEMNSSEEGSINNYVSVKFVGAGDVTVTITLRDNYGTEKSIDAKFNAVEKVYPTQDNWEIEKDLEDEKINVGSQVQFSVKWLEEINTEYTISWSVDVDNEIATITSRNGLLTAMAEGEVIVTAKVTTENNVSYTKSMTITILPAGEDDVLPAEACGEWADDNGDFTFTVKRDGTAVMVIYGEKQLNFNFTKMNGEYYDFVCEEDSSIELELWVQSSGANLAPITDEMYIEIGGYFMWNSGATLKK